MKKISSLLPGYRYIVTAEVLKLIWGEKRPPVFLCIGSSQLCGDRLGPAIGQLLVRKHDSRAFVYGTLERPVTRKNVLEAHDFIRKNHEGKLFAIDAALGMDEEKGMINIYRGGLKPAASAGCDLPMIGDFCLTVNVNSLSIEGVVALASVRERKINELGVNIAQAISDALTIHWSFLHTKKAGEFPYPPFSQSVALKLV
ncbi:MAG: DUF1256 domain-containing protein [Clostridiales bacterium]|jgi:putative sporulation protein YyaC|nr:DUF1256 domain-containing protein [Clostridiales bacterium]